MYLAPGEQILAIYLKKKSLDFCLDPYECHSEQPVTFDADSWLSACVSFHKCCEYMHEPPHRISTIRVTYKEFIKERNGGYYPWSSNMHSVIMVKK